MRLVPRKVTRSIGRKILVTKKNSPHIFFASGVVGIVGTVVLACRATLKLEETLEVIKKDVQDVKNMKRSDTEYQKDLIYIYSKSGVSVARLYGPSIILGSVSVACLTGSHVQLTRRNAALTATLVAVSQAYEDYRARVRQEIGEVREREIYQSVEDGDKAGKEYQDNVATNGLPLSPYARWFDQSNRNWFPSPEHNRVFIEAQREYANHLLQARGHVFLNDVYDSLGFERTSAGAVVGWVMDGEGDNYIDFSALEPIQTMQVSGYERSFFLDFNVDGVVYDKIER